MIKIDRKGILHIPNSNFAYATDEENFCVRLRASKGNLTRCTLYYADRVCETAPILFTPIPMEEVATDRDFSYYEAKFMTPYSRICYYFKLETEDEWSYYYSGFYTKNMGDVVIDGKLLDGRSEYYQYPAILRTELAQVPDWLKHGCVYNIFPDSFADGKRAISDQASEIIMESGAVSRSNHGGTIKGITANLDYIQELGCNCLYLNSIFAAASYHKYDTIDYMQIDPCLGTNDDLKELVESAHARGMKVILDGVFNHCGSQFFAFRDVVEKGKDSSYLNWFYHIELPIQRENEAGIPNYTCFAYVADMPKLNTANPEVQKYFAEVCRYWIEEYRIDGWRLDVSNEVSKEFWHTFKRTARSVNPESVLIGEVWENAQDWLRFDLFESTMNYDFRRHCRDFFAMHRIDSAEFNTRVTDLRMRYPEDYWRAQLNLLDSHDVARFLSVCEGNMDRLKQAIAFQMLFPGVPSIFAGDEVGVRGLTEPEYRAPMPWGYGDQDLFAFYQKAIALHKLPEVQNGNFRCIFAEENTMVYKCSVSYGGSELKAVFNSSEHSIPCEISEGTKILIENHYSEEKLGQDGFVVFATS